MKKQTLLRMFDAENRPRREVVADLRGDPGGGAALAIEAGSASATGRNVCAMKGCRAFRFVTRTTL